MTDGYLYIFLQPGPNALIYPFSCCAVSPHLFLRLLSFPLLSFALFDLIIQRIFARVIIPLLPFNLSLLRPFSPRSLL